MSWNTAIAINNINNRINQIVLSGPVQNPCLANFNLNGFSLLNVDNIYLSGGSITSTGGEITGFDILTGGDSTFNSVSTKHIDCTSITSSGTINAPTINANTLQNITSMTLSTGSGVSGNVLSLNSSLQLEWTNGGGGGVGTLQQVLNNGNQTTTNIAFKDHDNTNTYYLGLSQGDGTNVNEGDFYINNDGNQMIRLSHDSSNIYLGNELAGPNQQTNLWYNLGTVGDSVVTSLICDQTINNPIVVGNINILQNPSSVIINCDGTGSTPQSIVSFNVSNIWNSADYYGSTSPYYVKLYLNNFQISFRNVSFVGGNPSPLKLIFYLSQTINSVPNPSQSSYIVQLVNNPGSAFPIALLNGSGTGSPIVLTYSPFGNLPVSNLYLNCQILTGNPSITGSCDVANYSMNGLLESYRSAFTIYTTTNF